MRGRYMLESTLWLARQLRLNPDAWRNLRRAWLVRHQQETGYPLADVARSYRVALRNARRWNKQRQGTVVSTALADEQGNSGHD